MNLTCKVSICVFSPDFSPHEIAEKIGLPADRQIIKGSSRGKSPILKHAEHVWIVESKEKQSESIDKHVMDLKNRLAEYKPRISALQSSCTIQCTCILTCDSDPPLNLSSDLVCWLSEIGASLDIDQYISKEQ